MSEAQARVPAHPGALDIGRLGIPAVLVATSIWSFGGVLGYKVDAPGVVVTFWRTWLAVALFVVILHVRGGRLSWRMARIAGPAGAIFGLNLVAFFTAIRHTSIANAAIIGALTPILIAPIARVLFGERFTPVKAICSVVAVGGVAIAVLSEGGLSGANALGDGMAVVSLLLWVTYLIASKSARARLSTLEFMTGTTIAGAVTVSLLVAVTRPDLGAIDGSGWWWLVLLTVGPGAAGHGLVAWAHEHVDVNVSSVLIQGEPIGATVAAVFVLDQSLVALQIVAISVVVVAVGTLAWTTDRARVPPDRTSALADAS